MHEKCDVWNGPKRNKLKIENWVKVPKQISREVLPNQRKTFERCNAPNFHSLSRKRHATWVCVFLFQSHMLKLLNSRLHYFSWFQSFFCIRGMITSSAHWNFLSLLKILSYTVKLTVTYVHVHALSILRVPVTQGISIFVSQITFFVKYVIFCVNKNPENWITVSPFS